MNFLQGTAWRFLRNALHANARERRRAGAGSNAPRGTGEGKATLGAWV